MLNIIVTSSYPKNAIGTSDGLLPWDLSEDHGMHFTRMTTRQPSAILMGRVTWELFGCKPLPRRKNIIVSATLCQLTEHKNDEELAFAPALEAAIALAGELEIFVIGGQTLFEEAVKKANAKIYHTVIYGEFPEANVFWKIPLGYVKTNESRIEATIDGKTGKQIFYRRCEWVQNGTQPKLPKKGVPVVYTITNRINNKTYYGSSQNVQARWTTHKSALERGVHHNIFLQRSWNKHGPEAFTFNILAQCSSIEEAREMEEDLLKEHFLTPLCFNLSAVSSGGDNTSHHPNNTAIREKLSISGKRIFANMTKEERQQRCGRPGEQNGMFGKTHTEQARKRMSERITEHYKEHGSSKKGTHPSEATRAKISAYAKQRTGTKNPFYGRSHTEETKRKLSVAHKGVPKLACAYKVRVDGVEYVSATEAGRKLKMNLGTILNRCRSPKFITYELIGKHHEAK